MEGQFGAVDLERCGRFVGLDLEAGGGGQVLPTAWEGQTLEHGDVQGFGVEVLEAERVPGEGEESMRDGEEGRLIGEDCGTAGVGEGCGCVREEGDEGGAGGGGGAWA